MTDRLEDVRGEMRELLRRQSLRATAPRVAVLVALHERGTPMTHESVMDDLGVGAFDRATVFRILSDLSEQGLLRRMDLGDRVWRFELLDACRAVADDHAHFLCEDCGAVSCLPPLELRAVQGPLPIELQGAEIKLRVSGRCADCVA